MHLRTPGLSSPSTALYRSSALKVIVVSPPTIECGADGREKHKAAAALLKKSLGRKGFRQPRIAPRQNAYRRELKASEVLSVIRLAREQCRPAMGLRGWPQTRLGAKSNVRRRTGPGFRKRQASPHSRQAVRKSALEVAGVASMGDGETADGVLGFSSLLSQRPDISDGETGVIENSLEIRPLARSPLEPGLVHKHW